MTGVQTCALPIFEAKKYLLERGLSEKSIKLFKVGFAPGNSKYLLNAIKSKNYNREVLEKSGLFGFSNDEFFDRFRSRIMFPIANSSGKIIALVAVYLVQMIQRNI